MRLPEGVLVATVLRGEDAIVARADTRLLPGDHLLCLLPPGREKALIRALVPGERPEVVQAQGSIEITEDS